MIIKLMQLAVI